jgi:hypothetical protein
VLDRQAAVCVFAILTAIDCVHAQELLTRGSRAEQAVQRAFDDLSKPSQPVLRCTVTPLKARLTFAFRYWAGFDAEMPARQFDLQRASRLLAVLRVTPAGGAPVYLRNRLTIPPLPEGQQPPKNVDFSVGGGMLLGAGSYRIELIVADETRRVCRKVWTETAKVPNMQLRIQPGVVEESRIEDWSGIPAKAGASTATVLLHAAPLYRRRNVVRLSVWDITALLSSLTTLLDQSPYRSARVVAFNLDAGRVIFDEDHFDSGAYRKLIGALRELDLGTIEIGRLGRATPGKLLGEIASRELERVPRSDSLIVLGPSSRYDEKPAPAVKEVLSAFPKSLAIRIPFWAVTPDDSLTRFVKAAGGKSIDILQVSDLAKAIRNLNEMMKP